MSTAPPTPKRRLSNNNAADERDTQRARIDMTGADNQNNNDMPSPNAAAAPDSLIDHTAAIAYWSSTPATVDGVLGGYPQVSRVDLQGSANFLAKLRRQAKQDTTKKLKRAVDCGAGIGRVTTGFLGNIAEEVDIVEPVKAFTDQVKEEKCVGRIYNVGLEGWEPEGEYDLIWNQWCVGQLTDAQLVAYLKKLPAHLQPGGWIIVKENMSNHQLGEDVFDETDSSVTRTDTKFRKIFEDAQLRLVTTEVQKGFPKELYPVRVYALQPK